MKTDISISSIWRRWLRVSLVVAWLGGTAVSHAQSFSNSLSLEISTNGLRLHYIFRGTNGAFSIVQSGRLEDILRVGQALLSADSSAGRTGVVDIPWPQSPSFFALVPGGSGPSQEGPIPSPPRMLWIPPGTFTMGSPEEEKERDQGEGPQTLVTLTKGFYIGRYEVTQGEFVAVMKTNLSSFTGSADLPMESVTWYDASEYCFRLTTSERTAGRLAAGWEYRLPTEAEWEYACRAGTSTPFHYGPDLRSGMANFNARLEYIGGTGTVTNETGIFLDQTTTGGQYQPNDFGLYDLHGNVWEWCWDWYGPYLGGSAKDPDGPFDGDFGVIRGGSWYFAGQAGRSAYRFPLEPDFWYEDVGFRIVLAQTQ